MSLKNRIKDHRRYLEILISSFVEHEKNLNDLIVKLEKIVEQISEVTERILEEKEARKGKNSLVFIKIADVSREEQKKIREILN